MKFLKWFSITYICIWDEQVILKYETTHHTPWRKHGDPEAEVLWNQPTLNSCILGFTYWGFVLILKGYVYIKMCIQDGRLRQSKRGMGSIEVLNIEEFPMGQILVFHSYI